MSVLLVTNMKNKNSHTRMNIVSVFAVALGLASASSTFGQGCCAGTAAQHSGCPMAGPDPHAAQADASDKVSPQATAFPREVAAVFDNYIRVQATLAKDSLDDVSKNAQTIAKAVKDDSMTTFPASVVQQAETLAKADGLRAARDAFKPLSQSLIDNLSKYPAVARSLHQVHCSMANASWLQTGDTILNPYLGKSMVHCGEFVKTANPTDSESSHSGHSTHVH